jgi:hypothetical protein
MKEVKQMSTKELVEEYNALTGKTIKRFATRQAGERQLEAARAGKGKGKGKGPRPTKPVKVNPQPNKVVTMNRSEAIRESWNDKGIAASRATRDNVAVEGHEGVFRSVGEAFKTLKLPMGKHIRFRGELKQKGKLTFTHNNKEFNFKVVKKEATA